MNHKTHTDFSHEVAKGQTKEQFVADHFGSEEAANFWDKVHAKGDEADTEKPAKPKGK